MLHLTQQNCQTTSSKITALISSPPPKTTPQTKLHFVSGHLKSNKDDDSVDSV